MACRYSFSTPSTERAGAIAVIELLGDVDPALHTLGIAAVPVGAARLRAWPGVDSIVLARVSTSHAVLFPHAGPAIARRAAEALRRAGLSEIVDPIPHERFPEAPTARDARLLDALRRASSPLAIDLLLDQPRRWALADAAPRDQSLRHAPHDAARLNHLIQPPRVVALGPPNIGKSSMLNALAGRGVSIVADLPGTTRDHIGVALDLAGLVVTWIDTPGIGPLPDDSSPSQRTLDLAAQHLALDAARDADLLVLCADPSTSFIPNPPAASDTLRVCLRADLGPPPPGADLDVSVRNNTGLDLLTTRLRDALVPPPLLASPRAWGYGEF